MDKNQFIANISPKPGSVSTIICSYKSVVTKHARKIMPEFGWQPRFYDHIIRNDGSYERIRQYIIDNQKKWEKDRFYGR
jgi:REP element-mobilizing transposase RayT